MAGATAYCVSCKAKRSVVGAKMTTASNGARMQKGTCSKCGSKTCKIVGRK